jgi:hypothetical protein
VLCLLTFTTFSARKTERILANEKWLEIATA